LSKSVDTLEGKTICILGRILENATEIPEASTKYQCKIVKWIFVKRSKGELAKIAFIADLPSM
jgi:hypothetical protein